MPDPTTTGLGVGLQPVQGVATTPPVDPVKYDDRPVAWRVLSRYRVELEPRPGVGWRGGGVELIAGTVVSTEHMDQVFPGFAEWVMRDSPGTIEPTDEPATSEPKRHVPTHRLSGVARGAW